MGEDGSPRSFTRLEYMNVHRLRFHTHLGLSQIYAGRASALKISSTNAPINKEGARKASSKSYVLGNRAMLAFYAELASACIAHKSVLAASESAFVAQFLNEVSKHDRHNITRQPPTQCIICRGDLYVLDGSPSRSMSVASQQLELEPTSPIVGSKLSPVKVSEDEIEDLCEKITSLPEPNKGKAICLAQMNDVFCYVYFLLIFLMYVFVLLFV